MSYRGLSVIALAPVLDEERKIGDVVRRTPLGVVDRLVIIDDGSTDRSAEVARDGGAEILDMGRTVGVGAALRAGYDLAVRDGFDVAVVMAGNNKDCPEEIPRLLDPIADARADFVQGSRWLGPVRPYSGAGVDAVRPYSGAGVDAKRQLGDMPVYRRLATRLHPLLFSLVARRRITDSTNGFRAVHTRVLSDPRLRLDQPWLDEYELEPYLFLKAIRLGFRVLEVPVTKVYPPKELGQTKMKPVVGWWSIMRPVVYLGLGIRR